MPLTNSKRTSKILPSLETDMKKLRTESSATFFYFTSFQERGV